MKTLVLTAIGEDRAGLVQALAEVIGAHGGNWQRSRLAELDHMFAGIVEVTVPDESSSDLIAALRPLEGLLDVVVREAAAPPAELADSGQRAGPSAGRRIEIEVVGDDRPGIVRQVTSVLADAGLSLTEIVTDTRDAPMAGGTLFEAHIVATLPPGTEPGVVRAPLEQLSAEILVDIRLAEVDSGPLAGPEPHHLKEQM